MNARIQAKKNEMGNIEDQSQALTHEKNKIKNNFDFVKKEHEEKLFQENRAAM